MQANKEPQEKTGFRAFRPFFFTMTMLAAVLCASLAFISLELALLASGFLTLVSFIFFDSRQRLFWEQAISFRLKTLSDETSRSRIDIKGLKKEIRETALQAKNAAPPEPQAPEVLMRKFENPVPPLRAQRPGAKEKPSDEARIVDHSELTDTVVRELMHHAINTGEVNVFVQPIVRLPQRQTRFFEIFARIRARPGTYIPAGRYMPLARQDGVIHDIDHLLLARCLKTIEMTAQQDHAPPFFLNITPGTLGNKAFMGRLLGFLAKNRNLAERLVFEIRQKDFETMQPAILEILRGLATLGCALSIDHVTRFEFDLKFLQVLKVRFVKFEAKTLLAKSRDEKAAAAIWRLKRQLEGNGIGFIAEKIETEHMLRELLDFDINYGQGYLFGRPDLQSTYTPVPVAKKIA